MAFVAEQLGVDVATVPQLARELSPLRDPVAVQRLVTLIRRLQPHILHTHTAKAGAIGRTAALLAGVARPPIVVHTFHGHVLRGYFNTLQSEVYRRIEQELARRTDTLVAVSPQVRDDLVALGVAPAAKFEVVRLGIELDVRLTSRDDEPDYRRLFGVPDDAFVVGWVGRMTTIKRLPDVIAIFARLRELDVDARLCLVGDGPTRDLAEETAHRLSVVRHCLFLGYQRDVAGFYRFFDALLLPSANEGTPVSAIEALAAERPVVATAVGGVPDVVEEGRTGFLVPPGDLQGAADRLARLARDPGLRAGMGARGSERMRSGYSVERLVNDIDRLYRSLLERKGLPSPEPDRLTSVATRAS